jgi:hypothetical protein
MAAAAAILATLPLHGVTGQVEAPPPAASGLAAKPAPAPGMAVVSSDGTKVGTVHTIDATPDGRVTAVNVSTGGFLGLGTRVVAVPEGRFTLADNVVRISMTADELNDMPSQGR